MKIISVVNKKIPEKLKNELSSIGKLLFVNGSIEKILESSDFELVISVGGDGTHSAVFNWLLNNELETPVFTLPWGSGNDFAKELGIEQNKVFEYLEMLKNEEFYVRRFEVIEAEVEGKVFYSIVGLHFGIFAKVTEENPINVFLKKIFGRKAYEIIGLAIIPFFKPDFVSSGAFKGSIWAAQLANTKFTGGGIPVMPFNNIFDGRFAFIFASSAIPRWELPLELLDLKKGKHIGKSGYYWRFLRKVKLEGDFLLAYDGEFIGRTSEVKARIKEKAGSAIVFRPGADSNRRPPG